MIKKYLILIFITFFFNSSVFSLDKADKSYMNPKNSNFKKGFDAIKQAKKYEKKGKITKSKKRFEDAIKFLVKAKKEIPNHVTILSYLGYSLIKVDDFFMAEIYYLEGLEVDPYDKVLNQYLGELYFVTNRIDLAKEKLEVIKDCSCDEYDKLKGLIEGTRKSSY